ncbi:MAG: inner membrane CreD family protein [Verrucomicrobiales bacterium]|nr:inner membrane CreD family protein [Verrucomicrobiales bacterium]
MNVNRLFAILFIVVGTGVAWFVLGNALTYRTAVSGRALGKAVEGNWGVPMRQMHPEIFYISPTAANARREIHPESSDIKVNLDFDKQKKGLLWYRTYKVDFSADYIIKNPTPITQTIYISFKFPAKDARYDQFSFVLGEKKADKAPRNGGITDAVILKAGEQLPVRLTYTATGLDDWIYSFGRNHSRVRNFNLEMLTDFKEIDIPAGSESPTSRKEAGEGLLMNWNYNDVIGASAVGMAMPAVTNPGPVAARITYFAPVSLLFFFAVIVILGAVRKVDLHPMNYFFLAAGCFAFQLLFSYLVDLIPTILAFVIAAAVSLLLVNSYLAKVVDRKFALVSVGAQFAYMVLFSASFFFEGLTGITITIGSIVTLAVLMSFTAKVDWSEIFKREPKVKVNMMPDLPVKH